MLFRSPYFENLHSLTCKIKRDLIQRLNNDQIIGFQNRVPQIEGLSLGSTIDADGETSVLTEGGGEWDME